MADLDRYISDRDTLERLVRLETKVCLKFEELDKALILARDTSEKSRVEARETIEKSRCESKETIDHRLEGLNQYQKRIDRLEGTFATKDDRLVLNTRIDKLERVVYMGVGIALAFQLVAHFLFK